MTMWEYFSVSITVLVVSLNILTVYVYRAHIAKPAPTVWLVFRS